MKKISRQKFIQAIENNIDCKSDKELALELGITPEWFSKLKNRYAPEIKEAARKIIKKNSATLVGYLMRNAKSGSDNAAKYLLDMEKALDMELMIKQLQLEIEKIKEMQSQQHDNQANMGLLRKTG